MRGDAGQEMRDRRLSFPRFVGSAAEQQIETLAVQRNEPMKIDDSRVA